MRGEAAGACGTAHFSWTGSPAKPAKVQSPRRVEGRRLIITTINRAAAVWRRVKPITELPSLQARVRSSRPQASGPGVGVNRSFLRHAREHDLSQDLRTYSLSCGGNRDRRAPPARVGAHNVDDLGRFFAGPAKAIRGANSPRSCPDSRQSIGTPAGGRSVHATLCRCGNKALCALPKGFEEQC